MPAVQLGAGAGRWCCRCFCGIVLSVQMQTPGRMLRAHRGEVLSWVCCDWSRVRELLRHSDTGQGGICVQSLGEPWRHGAVSKTASVMETDKKKTQPLLALLLRTGSWLLWWKRQTGKLLLQKPGIWQEMGNLRNVAFHIWSPPSILSGWLLCAKQGAGCS